MLAGILNISHQQFQKYETGKNRISAGHFPAIARILAVPISYFFEGLPEPGFPESVTAVLMSSPETRLLSLTAECLTFLELFVHIQDAKARASVQALVLSLTDSDGAAP